MVVLDDITQMVSAAVVGFADAHGVVGEVDIAVVACLTLVRAWEYVELSLRSAVTPTEDCGNIS